MNKKISIAIDGPSGVGKSTIAKKISSILGLIFINTGLMYRTIAYYCLQNNIDFYNDKLLESILNNIDINLLPNEEVELNGNKILTNLWKDEISSAASIVAKNKMVREKCVNQQQQIAKNNSGVVMEGRDIGTVVMPNAELKVFLTASAEVRAHRRVIQLEQKGEKVDYESILKNVLERDARDTKRDVAPLIKANDAIEIDTSNLSIEQVIDKIILLAKNKMN